MSKSRNAVQIKKNNSMCLELTKVSVEKEKLRIKQALEPIYELMDQHRFQDSLEVLDRLKKDTVAIGWTDMLRVIAELKLATAIELKDIPLAETMVVEVSDFTETAYGVFLQARVADVKQDYYRCWQLASQAAELAENSADDFRENQVIRSKIYNLLAHTGNFFGWADKTCEFYLKAAENAPEGRLTTLEYSNYLFTLHYLNMPSEAYANAHKKYGAYFNHVKQYEHEAHYIQEALTSAKHESRKIRIGYISPDFRYHVVLRFIYAQLMNYDKDSFQVYCYANCYEDEYSQEIKAHVDGWRNILFMPSDKVAQLIYEDHIDILMDFAGHTMNNCLPVLAYKPAPVQISGIGYFATTGLPAVDYFLTDKYLESNEHEHFVEDFLTLEHSHFCYTALGDAPEPQGAPCIENGYITLGSFNNISKVNDGVLALWLEIMKRLPDSRLFLKGSLFDSKEGHAMFCERIKNLGADMSSPEWQDRFILRGRSKEYMKEYLEMDIALDTFPYPGGGTTCDALYMGVPVITLALPSHGGRFGASLIHNIGLSECIAASKEDYVQRVLALASDYETLDFLHKGLRNMMVKSPLMNRELYMSELESGYRAIWAKYLQEKVYTQDGTAKAPKALGKLNQQELMNEAFFWYKQGAFSQAEWYCQQAVVKDEAYRIECIDLLGDIYQSAGRFVDSLEASEKATELLDAAKDKGTVDFQLRIYTNLAARYRKLGQLPQAGEAYYRAYEIALANGGNASAAGAFASYLNCLLCLDDKPDTFMQEISVFDKLFSQEKATANDDIRKSSHHSDGKIHIAYLSPDFRQHVMFSFYYALLQGYDKGKFHVTCVSLAKNTDAFTDHLSAMVDEWVDASELSVEQMAGSLQALELDILVDLAGWSAGTGLPVMAQSVASVQISGLGWMESTGFAGVDYLITDKLTDPEDACYITEKPLYLSSQFCYVGRNDVPTAQGAPCKIAGYITFGVFNHYYKITDEMVIIWREIMDVVSDSRLLLKCDIFADEKAQEMARQRFAGLGLDNARIDLEPTTMDYMTRYLDVDIALDTYPYPGGGTTCDAMYMGVPVVSRYGTRRGSRFGYSILNNAGFGELAAATPEEYMVRAVGLARDVETLDVIHKNLRDIMRKSNLMNCKKYVSEVENWYMRLINN